MKDATYRMLFFPKINRFLAVAWNYKEAVMIATADYGSYTEARKALDPLCVERGVRLRWFDGEYEVGDDEMLYPTEIKHTA